MNNSDITNVSMGLMMYICMELGIDFKYQDDGVLKINHDEGNLDDIEWMVESYKSSNYFSVFNEDCDLVEQFVELWGGQIIFVNELFIVGKLPCEWKFQKKDFFSSRDRFSNSTSFHNNNAHEDCRKTIKITSTTEIDSWVSQSLQRIKNNKLPIVNLYTKEHFEQKELLHFSTIKKPLDSSGDGINIYLCETYSPIGLLKNITKDENRQESSRPVRTDELWWIDSPTPKQVDIEKYTEIILSGKNNLPRNNLWNRIIDNLREDEKIFQFDNELNLSIR